jgi:hypothetical protein
VFRSRSRDKQEQDAAMMSPENSILMKAIDARLKRALRPGKIMIAITMVLALAIAVVAALVVVNNRDQVNGLRNDAVRSCQAANEQRSVLGTLLNQQGEVQSHNIEVAFIEFINVAEGPHPTKAVLAIAKSLEDKIKASSDASNARFKRMLDAATAPRNCSAA